MWSLKNRWKIRNIRSVFVLWAAFVIIAGKVLMTFCKLWLVLVIQSLCMHCASTLQCASQSLFSSNFTKTISPNQFLLVFFQASLPLVEPVAVVEAAIDDLIEDRVALERLEEVANMCFFRCASISWFEVVSRWVIHIFTASASTGLSDYLFCLSFVVALRGG